MSDLTVAGPLDVITALRSERRSFCELLGTLSPDDWDLPTECPAWSVKGVALHILGDDFSLLSRQRDAATDSLTLMAAEQPDWDFPRLLDGFNEAWVYRARFMSPRLVIELLRVTGDLTADFYATVDPDLPGEPVYFVGPEPAPYWMIAAREYAERWIHHLQVARATSRPGPTDLGFVAPAVAAVMRGFPAAMAVLPAQPGDEVSFSLRGSDAGWTLVKGDRVWTLHDGVGDRPTVRLGLAPEQAAGLFSRAFYPETIREGLVPVGDTDLGGALCDGLAAFFGRAREVDR